MRMTLLIGLAFASPAFSSDDTLRREACLLGQETATLYYELLQKRPDMAKEIHEDTNTRIDRRAYYWATIYVEKGLSYDELSDTYFYVCMKTGPSRIPPPQVQ